MALGCCMALSTAWRTCSWVWRLCWPGVIGAAGAVGTLLLPVAASVDGAGAGSTESEVICFFAKKPMTATTKSRLNTPKINRIEFLSKIMLSAARSVTCRG